MLKQIKEFHTKLYRLEKKLTNPLRIQLVEEAVERISKSLSEVYMVEGKSGWEERETGRHGHE